MIIDKTPRVNVNTVNSNSKGYHRRQVWTNPALGTVTGVLPSVMAASDLLSANFYKFTVTSANATLAATFTNNGATFTVLATIASGTTLYCSGTGAPAASGTLTKATGTGDATVTFSAAVVGFTQPDFPRAVSVTGTLATHTASGNVVIKGTDIRGAAITDTIALNSNTTVNGVKAFAKVTEIDLSGTTGMTSVSGVEVGTTAYLGIDRICSGNEVMNGTVDGTAEATLPVITKATTIGGNLVLFNTALANTKTYVVNYIATESTADPSTTA